MGEILVGTSGYSFPDWIGPFYPPELPRADHLAFYARHFNVVEVNTSYYRVPAPGTLARMASRTPPEFRFILKLHQDMTHKESREPALYREFQESIAPLRESGKFHGLLAQFPWAFRVNRESVRHLAFLRKSFPGDSLHVEFRRAEWNRPDCFDFLEGRGIGYCCVDEPSLPGLLPAQAAVTTPVGYVRFHGRNSANWWGRGTGDRYDYDYSRKELSEWLGRLKSMAEKAQTTYVFFNNCHAGHAAANAMLMKDMLAREGLPF